MSALSIPPPRVMEGAATNAQAVAAHVQLIQMSRCCCGCWPGYSGVQNAARNSPKFAAGYGEAGNRHRGRSRSRRP